MDLQSLTNTTLRFLKNPIFTFANKYEFRANILSKESHIGLYDRWILHIHELEPNRFRFTMSDVEANRNEKLSAEIKDGVEMSRLLVYHWSDKIEWWCSRLTSYRLQPNKQYQVLQDFKDYYGSVIKSGTKLTFVSQNFVPYHGGYTFQFAEMAINLQEDDNADILSDFDLYFEEIS